MSLVTRVPLALARRVTRRLPPDAQLALKRLALRRRRAGRVLATDPLGRRRATSLADPPGAGGHGVTAVLALGADRDGLARACAHAAELQQEGRGALVISDRDDTDLARRHGVLLELLPDAARWRAITGADANEHRRFLRARLDLLAQAWGVTAVRRAPAPRPAAGAAPTSEEAWH